MKVTINGQEEELKSIIVFGRSWFSKTSGTSYCTSEIYINGKFLAKTSNDSGYGDYYIQVAMELLYQNGILTSAREPLWILQEKGVRIHTSLALVAKEKDL